MLFQDAGPGEGDAAVEGGLAPEGKEDAVGLLLLDHLLGVLRGDRQEVGGVGHAGARLDGGDVRIDEDGPNALLPKRLEGLASRVVELAGLADLEPARAEEKNRLDFAHCVTPFPVPDRTVSRK